MRALDLVATAAALGVFGYFVYKVILPKLAETEFPTFQAPSVAPPIEQPVTPPQQPAEQLPPAQPIEQDPEKPKKEEEPKEQAPLVPSRSPPAAISPPSAGGAVLYDSNTHGKWNNGVKRANLTKEGSTSPNGKGFQKAASGSPTLTIDGNGVAHLQTSGSGTHGRVYIYANNYNARLEGNFMFETSNIDNISIKIRSRHEHSGKTVVGGSGCPCGGIGVGIHLDGSISLKAESCHGTNPGMGSGKAPAFQVGKWYKFTFSVWDSGATVESKMDIDGKTVGTGKWTSPNAACKTKSLFDTDSYFWLRINNTSGTAKAAFSNLRLVDLGASANVGIIRRLMIDEPYLYNGYYNRRRL